MENYKAKDYFWMDGLFKNLVEKKTKFKNQWLKTPFLYCEEIGSSTLANYNFGIENDTKLVKEILNNKPPYVLKLPSNFRNIFPKLDSKNIRNLMHSLQFQFLKDNIFINMILLNLYRFLLQ